MSDRESKRKSELNSVSKVLQTLLGNGKSPLSDQFLRWRLWRFWPDVVGASLAKISEPVGYERGRLLLWVKSSAQMQEIRFFETVIVEKVNAYVSRKWVKEVRFTLDRKGIPMPQDVDPEFKRFLEHDPNAPTDTD